MAQGVTECDRLAAVPGDPEAVAPGVEYWNLKLDRAIAACELAANEYPTTVRTKFQLLVVKLYQNRKLKQPNEKVIDSLKKISTDGYVHAFFFLGKINENHFFSKKDLGAAEAYYKSAVKLGSRQAQVALGALYASSRNEAVFGEKKVLLGEKWLDEAASRSDPDALYALASRLIESDRKRANRLLTLSANQGNPRAMYLLYLMHANEDNPFYSKKSAKLWLNRAAENGFPQALFALAHEYFLGGLYRRNLEKTADWLAAFKDKMSGTESDDSMGNLKKLLAKIFLEELEIYHKQKGKKHGEKK